MKQAVLKKRIGKTKKSQFWWKSLIKNKFILTKLVPFHQNWPSFSINFLTRSYRPREDEHVWIKRVRFYPLFKKFKKIVLIAIFRCWKCCIEMWIWSVIITLHVRSFILPYGNCHARGIFRAKVLHFKEKCS